jgi:predicted TIM-barrel fold metal-dependent hydrolase
MTPASVIDACAFHEWPSQLSLLPYMPVGWAELIKREADIGGPMNIKSQWLFEHPRRRNASDALYYGEVRKDKGGPPPGTEVGDVIGSLLDGTGTERVVLGYYDGLLATAYPLPYVAREVVRAVNDWTVAEWLEADERLHGMVLIASAIPSEAVSEIRRVGSHPRMVAVALGANGLGLNFGHPAYHEIYEAAAELGLPLVLQAGCDGMSDQVTVPTAAGIPTTYAVFDALSAQSLATHVISMVTGGVFERFPDLQVLLVGGGAAWVPTFLWRWDFNYRISRRIESPWLSRTPPEYFARHFLVSTYGLERPPRPEQLARVLRVIPDVESVLMYASGYTRHDAESPEEIAARLPEEWHERVFHTNATDFFRWPDAVRPHGERVAALDTTPIGG